MLKTSQIMFRLATQEMNLARKVRDGRVKNKEALLAELFEHNNIIEINMTQLDNELREEQEQVYLRLLDLLEGDDCASLE